MPVASSKPRVAVVIPFYNPPPHWEENCLEHIVSLQTFSPEYNFQFVLVNDGSDSNIFRRIQRILRKSKIAFKTYNLETNAGKGKALSTGLRGVSSSTKYIICVDWDFPFGVLIIGDILQKLQEGYDVVLANRGTEYLKKIPFTRSILTRVWRVFIKKILGLQLPDTQAGVKGFRHSVTPYFLKGKVDSFLHAFEFILNCQAAQLKMTTVKAHIAAGVTLHEFSLKTYFKELKMLVVILRDFYAKSSVNSGKTR